MPKTIQFPKTPRGNDPADHVDDHKYESQVRNLVENKTDELGWLEDFTVTDEEAEQISDPVFIIPHLIVSGHIVLVAAEPNGGKTTIFFHFAGEMVKSGQRVIYVNADTSAGDAKSFIVKAKQLGIELLLPDMKLGKSMDDVVANMEGMNNRSVDLNGFVFVFDTLKKMTDVINKGAAKKLFKTLRGLSAKGATIILFAW